MPARSPVKLRYLRRGLSLARLGSVVALMAGACDGLRLPAPPANPDSAASRDAPAARTGARKPNRAVAGKGKADPAGDAQRFEQIRTGLRRLVVAEENYYAETGAYTEELSRIGFAPEGGVGVRFLWRSRGGWAASGSHSEMPGKDCVIYVGRAHGAPTTLRDVRSGREGVPVCDGAPVPRSRPAAAAPAAAAPAAPDTTSALDAVNPLVQMRVDLRNLVRSQDTYIRQQGVYARRTEPFALQFLWHRGVTLTILSATDAAWSARATHASRPGASCVIWLGPVTERPATAAQRRVPDRPATPACDD